MKTFIFLSTLTLAMSPLMAMANSVLNEVASSQQSRILQEQAEQRALERAEKIAVAHSLICIDRRLTEWKTSLRDELFKSPKIEWDSLSKSETRKLEREFGSIENARQARVDAFEANRAEFAAIRDCSRAHRDEEYYDVAYSYSIVREINKKTCPPVTVKCGNYERSFRRKPFDQ